MAWSVKGQQAPAGTRDRGLQLSTCRMEVSAWGGTLQALALSSAALLGAGHYATPQLRHLLLENFGVFGPIRRYLHCSCQDHCVCEVPLAGQR